MRDNTQQPPAEQFVLVGEAARLLNLDSKVLRRGIACGLVPIRRDNFGVVRVHLDEVPDDLINRIADADIQPDLHAVALSDEIAGLEKDAADANAQRVRLEALVEKQGAALARYAALFDMNSSDSDTPLAALASARDALSERDKEVRKLSDLLERTFLTIEARDRQVEQQSARLVDSSEKALNLLSRALQAGEASREQIQALEQQLATSADMISRLDKELDQRNGVIENQHGLIERMVTLAEQTPSGSITPPPRKRSFWQRLWGGGRGI